MTQHDDTMSIEELRRIVDQDPRGTWIEPEAGTSTIIFIPRPPEARNAPDAQSDRYAE